MVNPLKEFKEGNIEWKLKTGVYGLNYASRTLHLKVHDELIVLGARLLLYDPALFYWRSNNDFHGLLVKHDDDICWGGASLFGRKLYSYLGKFLKLSRKALHHLNMMAYLYSPRHLVLQ